MIMYRFGNPIIHVVIQFPFYYLSCNKGYNYYNQTHFGNNVTVYKGFVPFATAGSGFISIDTSSGSKYSDYKFICKPAIVCFFSFNRIGYEK